MLRVANDVLVKTKKIILFSMPQLQPSDAPAPNVWVLQPEWGEGVAATAALTRVHLPCKYIAETDFASPYADPCFSNIYLLFYTSSIHAWDSCCNE